MMDKGEEALLSESTAWVVTGGEPLLQAGEVLDTIRKYLPETVEIETNGTIAPPKKLLEEQSVFFNISPKEKRFQPKNVNTALKIFNCLSSKSDRYIVKFVYSDKKSERFISETIKKYNVPNKAVFIMAEGTTVKELKRHDKDVWDFCIRKGFNYSPRLQVILFGKKRGV